MRNKNWKDVFSVLLGIVLCVSIFLVIRHPTSRPSLLFLFFSGAGVNFANGFRYMSEPKQRNLGYSMMLLGAIILVIGFYVLLS